MPRRADAKPRQSSGQREADSDAGRSSRSQQDGETSDSDAPYSDRETLEQLRIIAEYRRRKAEIKAQFQATRKSLIVNKPLPVWASILFIFLFIYISHLLDSWYRPEHGYTTQFDGFGVGDGMYA